MTERDLIRFQLDGTDEQGLVRVIVYQCVRHMWSVCGTIRMDASVWDTYARRDDVVIDFVTEADLAQRALEALQQ